MSNFYSANDKYISEIARTGSSLCNIRYEARNQNFSSHDGCCVPKNPALYNMNDCSALERTERHHIAIDMFNRNAGTLLE